MTPPTALAGRLAPLILIAACQSTAFVCTDDEACDGAGPGARCEANGYCSYEDLDCETGRRYGELAGDFGGQCVEPLGADSSSGLVATSETSQDGGGTDEPGTTDGPGDTGETEPEPDWWDCDWAARRPLSIGPGRVDEPLAEVPILVVLDDSRIDPSIMDPTGTDLRFVSEDGVVLPHEIERWSPGDRSWIWVRVPELSPAGTVLRMYYGNPDAPSPATEVWTDYVGVWHMDFEYADATGLSPVEMFESTTASGQVASAQRFLENSNGASVTPSPAVSGLFAEGGTITAMIRASSWGSGGTGPIVERATSAEGADGWNLQLDGSRESLRFVRGFTTDRQVWSTAEMSIALETWHHVAVVYQDDATEDAALYIDGLPQPFEALGSPLGLPDPDDVAETMVIGGLPGSGTRWFRGFIDELRLAPVARSAEWIEVQNASLRDDLVVYGPEQSPICP